MFSCEFCEIFKSNLFLQNTFGSYFWVSENKPFLIFDLIPLLDLISLHILMCRLTFLTFQILDVKFFKNTFFIEHLWWLLLSIYQSCCESSNSVNLAEEALLILQIYFKWDACHGFLPFVQYKKCGEHPRKSVTFSIVAG